MPLEFGSVIHWCLEYQFTSKLTPSQVVNKVVKTYSNFRQKSLVSSGEREVLAKLLGLAKVVFPAYCEYWKADDKKIKWIEREQKFSIPYKVPMERANRKILLRGMRDGIFEDSTGIGVFETKTKSRVPSDQNINDQLKYDMQTMFYAWTSYLSTKKMPTKTLYNIIRRPDLYMRKQETLNVYLKRVAEDVEKRPEHYFLRWMINFDKTDMDMFVKKTLNPMLRDFIRWYDSLKKSPEDRFQSPYHFLDYNALFGKYGKASMFDAIHGRLRGYTIRTTPFPELEESFQALG